MSFANPQHNIDQFDLQPGMQVADFGAGTGAYSIAAAKKVGPDGKVIALEVQKDLLDKIRQNASNEHIFNIEVFWRDLEKEGGTKLNDASMDAVILSNLLFQVEKKEAVIKEVKRVLKANRKVLFIDWSDSAGGLGPIDDHVFYPDQAKKIFMENNFEYVRDIYAGDNHYGMIFRKEANNN